MREGGRKHTKKQSGVPAGKWTFCVSRSYDCRLLRYRQRRGLLLPLRPLLQCRTPRLLLGASRLLLSLQMAVPPRLILRLRTLIASLKTACLRLIPALHHGTLAPLPTSLPATGRLWYSVSLTLVMFSLLAALVECAALPLSHRPSMCNRRFRTLSLMLHSLHVHRRLARWLATCSRQLLRRGACWHR